MSVTFPFDFCLLPSQTALVAYRSLCVPGQIFPHFGAASQRDDLQPDLLSVRNNSVHLVQPYGTDFQPEQPNVQEPGRGDARQVCPAGDRGKRGQ